jgi:ABC-type branched-subunit amino acid transport system substrate-binding protein
LATLLALFISFSAVSPLSAKQDNWKIISWASPLGPQALSYDYLCGLKAMLSFINLYDGVNGTAIDIYSQEMDDGLPDFQNRLKTITQQVQPHLVVGGVTRAKSGETADFFRRSGMVWFGPWSNKSDFYRDRADDPIGLFPSVEEELDLLISYARKKLGPEGTLLLIHYQSYTSDKEISFAQKLASDQGINLITTSIANNFRNWGELEKEAMGIGGIILWLPAGPAAAVLRTLKNRLPEDVLWMTNSLNSPGQEVMEMTGGQWEGMIFPAVLSPKSSLTEAYDAVLYKYGPRGLTLDYQAYLGLAQAQVLVRGLQAAPINSRTAELRKALESVSTEGTLLYPLSLKTGPTPKGASYLAVATSNWGWVQAED